MSIADGSLLRAQSIASANHGDRLQFLTIKVPKDPLTSRLGHMLKGDPIFISLQPTDALQPPDLPPGKRWYLLSTGTGVAPFINIKDPEA